MDEKDIIQITYTTKDADTKEIIEDRKEPLLLQLKNSNLPDKVKDTLKNMKQGEDKEVFAEKPFGERQKDLINVVSLKQFTSNKINPFPGLIVDLDGHRALVKAVSGGRVVVDFNHLLAGKNLLYNLNVLKVIEKDKEKIEALVESQDMKGEIDIKEKKGTIKLTDKGDVKTATQRKNALFIALKQFLPELEIKLE
ncbi:hypothetical protein KO317_02470 [Candidatus Micrarchaeota archaeon]|nr:hypothetical protein [Candidatus Micrarchaeota archaeon]